MNADIRRAIERIAAMEKCFDALQAAWRSDPASLRADPELRAMLERLTAYYTGGQWLADYRLDEAGLLPPELKRGILSEDGFYDFLAEIEG